MYDQFNGLKLKAVLCEDTQYSASKSYHTLAYNASTEKLFF